MNDLKDYIKTILNNNELYSKVRIVTSDNGFHVKWARDKDKYFYHIYIPPDKADLSFCNKLSLLHEIGHIVFNELFYNNHTDLVQIMDDITYNKLFYFLQGFWYWNRLLRKIKQKMGYSSNINYKKEDLYDKSVSRSLTRRDNEYFCDYFALFLNKNKFFT